jgi:hypothetical protein
MGRCFACFLSIRNWIFMNSPSCLRTYTVFLIITVLLITLHQIQQLFIIKLDESIIIYFNEFGWCHPSISLKDFSKITRSIVQDSLFLGQELNWVPEEYKSDRLITSLFQVALWVMAVHSVQLALRFPHSLVCRYLCSQTTHIYSLPADSLHKCTALCFCIRRILVT